MAFRRSGHCSYNDKCTYAHGDNELRMPRRRPSVDYVRDRRSSRDDRDDRENRENREPRERRDSRSKRNDDSFSRGGGSSRYRDDNRRYQQSSSSRSSQRPICRMFEQNGHCPYGPRCRYQHIEQMPHFNGNATMYVPPSEIPMAFYHQQAQTFVVPYFVGAPHPPSHHPANVPTPTPQFLTHPDLNQSIPYYAPQGSYYYQPMAPTPVMDQSGVVVAGSETFPDGFFTQPPPAYAQPPPLMS